MAMRAEGLNRWRTLCKHLSADVHAGAIVGRSSGTHHIPL